MLESRLKRDAVSPPDLILKVALDVAEGLAAAHAKGLIHRDIKPANVWLEGDPTARELSSQVRRCKILDFGLAPSTSAVDVHLTASGTIVGTPAYMSPEQGRGEVVFGLVRRKLLRRQPRRRSCRRERSAPGDLGRELVLARHRLPFGVPHGVPAGGAEQRHRVPGRPRSVRVSGWHRPVCRSPTAGRDLGELRTTKLPPGRREPPVIIDRPQCISPYPTNTQEAECWIR